MNGTIHCFVSLPHSQHAPSLCGRVRDGHDVGLLTCLRTKKLKKKKKAPSCNDPGETKIPEKLCYLLAEIAAMFFHTFIFSFIYAISVMLFTYYFNLKSKAIKKTPNLSFLLLELDTPHIPQIHFQRKFRILLIWNHSLAFYSLYSSGTEPTFSSAISLYVFLLSQLNAVFLAVFFTLCSM